MAASVPLEGLHGALLALRGRARLEGAKVPPLARARVLHARVETELARLELPDQAGKLLMGPAARHPAPPAEGGSSPPATQFLVAQRMSEAPATVLDMCEVSTELDARLELVERLATPLPSLLPRMRDPELGRWMAQQLDALLRNVTAGCGALDVAIGEGLHALDIGRRAMDLKYSNIGDYAREELGINASTAAKMARLARKLQERPILRLAVRQGKVTPRKAEIIAPVAVGENELPWVLRGIAKTVRSLKVEVKAAGKAPPEPDDEKWVNFSSEVSPEKRAMLEEGLRLAGIVIGATARKMQRVNAWGQEYLSSHSAPADDHADSVLFTAADELEALKERLEQENDQWAGLAKVGPVKAEEFSGETDPWRIDAELKHFVEKRSRWDQVFGRAAMLFKRS